MYTAEQLARRNASPLTRAMMMIGGVQLIILVLSFYFLIRVLLNGRGWSGALAAFWLNFILLIINTAIGVIWEKQFYGKYFLCPEFFWEDVGNAAALLAYTFYFLGLLLGWSRTGLACGMLFASTVYGVNCAQWIFKRMIVKKKPLRA
jgi:3-vinyl bacteriochlorophyllide hydratase